MLIQHPASSRCPDACRPIEIARKLSAEPGSFPNTAVGEDFPPHLENSRHIFVVLGQIAASISGKLDIAQLLVACQAHLFVTALV